MPQCRSLRLLRGGGDLVLLDLPSAADLGPHRVARACNEHHISISGAATAETSFRQSRGRQLTSHGGRGPGVGVPTAVHACHGELHFGSLHLLAEVLQERSHLRRRRERSEAAGIRAAVDLKVPRRMFHRWRKGTEDNAASREAGQTRVSATNIHSPPRGTRRCSSCRRTRSFLGCMPPRMPSFRRTRRILESPSSGT